MPGVPGAARDEVSEPSGARVTSPEKNGSTRSASGAGRGRACSLEETAAGALQSQGHARGGESSLGGAEEGAPGEISEGSSPMRGAGAHGRSGEGRLNNKNRGLNKERECTKGNGIRLPTFCTPCGVGLERDTGNVRIFSTCKYRNAAAEGVSTHTP